MLGVNQPGEEQEEYNDMMPVQSKMDETRINGVAGPSLVSQAALPTRTIVEADLGRICSEELVKVTSTIPTGEPSGYGRPTEAPPRKPAANTVQAGAPCPYESSCSAAKECRSNAGRCGLMPTKLAESYYGYVETVEDAVMIVEACRFGRLMRVKRRLLEKERQGIRSGSVFVFVERESGIRRWTDGKVWSPSRICGEFLIYRELESRQANPNAGPATTGRKPNPATAAATASHVNWTEQVAKILAAKSRLASEENGEDEPSIQEDPLEPEKKRPTIQVSAAAVDSAVASIRLALAAASHNQANDTNGSSPAPQSTAGTSTSSTNTSGSGSGGKSMIFKRDGLIKKTISLTVSDETYHLICYFKDSNLGSELLHLTPSRMAAFKNLDLCRNPVSYPIMMLQPGHGMNSGTTNPIPPQQLQHQQQLHQQLHQQQLQQQQQQQMGYPGAGRIMSNGQYIAVPQAYMAQLMPPAHHSMQQARRLAPHHQQTIATGSVQLPPVLFKSTGSNNRGAGIANLLTDPSYSAVDMENIEVMMGNGNAMAGCGTGACPGVCPSSGSCSKTAAAAPNHAPVQPAADNLEEEQLLFCHFLEAIRHEDD